MSLKLSEAMRRGVAIVPLQAYGANLERRVLDNDEEDSGEEYAVEYRVCARGAAFIGAHEEIRSLEDVEIWGSSIRGAGFYTFVNLFWEGDGLKVPYATMPAQYEPGPGAVPNVAELHACDRPGEEKELLDLVVALNDHWQWPIAKIADYLEQLGQ